MLVFKFKVTETHKINKRQKFSSSWIRALLSFESTNRVYSKGHYTRNIFSAAKQLPELFLKLYVHFSL